MRLRSDICNSYKKETVQFKTYLDRKFIYSLQMVLCIYQKKSWRRLREVLRTSPGRRLEDVTWKTSCGRLLEDVLRTSPRRCLEDVTWRTSWGCLLEDVLRTSPRRCLEDVPWKTSWRRLKKGRCDFHFRPI